MRKLLLIFFFIPLLSFGQFDWKKGWNGNVELGTPLENVGNYIKYDRLFRRGFLGVKIYNESVLNGRLILKVGSAFESHFESFFILQKKHNKDYRFSATINYAIFQNRYLSTLIGLGYTRHKQEAYKAPYWYSYLQIDGVVINGEIWLFPISRISFGIDLSLGFGRSIQYNYKYYNKGTLFTVPHPLVFTLQYKLFQKEKVFFNK